MQLLHASAGILHGGASQLSPLVQQAANVLGLAFFWLTVVLAVTGSALSAFCIISPISAPKVEPYSFLGQWFIWLATPLLWATVALSLAYSGIKPFDVFVLPTVLAFCRGTAQAICDHQWRRAKDRRIPRVAYLARPQPPL